MPTRLLIANWKMHLLPKEAVDLIHSHLGLALHGPPSHKVVFAVPFPYLSLVGGLIKGTPHFALGAQNMHEALQGAYTGEVSAPMLRALGVEYVLIGHSERRNYYGETNDLLRAKIDTALGQGVHAVLCVGESLAQREEGTHFEYIATQVKTALEGRSPLELKNITLAYEPIWAIGTGKAASVADAVEIHSFIRKTIGNLFSEPLGAELSILYGGSVKKDNAAAFLQASHIDGALVGGASLVSDHFNPILRDFCTAR